MGKRSSFDRRERDFYPTPEAAVLPLLPHLPRGRTPYVEPCAGDGALVRHLSKLAPSLYCVGAFDLEPRGPGIGQRDARGPWVEDAGTLANLWITNLPWDRPALHRLVPHLAAAMPLWTLLDADWHHTLQAAPLLPLCRKIVAVGRVRWIPGSSMVAKDNCVWTLFEGTPRPPGLEVAFFGR